jgi:hypothetical protein
MQSCLKVISERGARVVINGDEQLLFGCTVASAGAASLGIEVKYRLVLISRIGSICGFASKFFHSLRLLRVF